MYDKVKKFLVEQIATTRPSNLRDRVLDILGGPTPEGTFTYQLGQVVQDKGSAESGDSARTYRISGRRIISGQRYYRLSEGETGEEVGLFHEDSIEPYEPLPENQAGGVC